MNPGPGFCWRGSDRMLDKSAFRRCGRLPHWRPCGSRIEIAFHLRGCKGYRQDLRAEASFPCLEERARRVHFHLQGRWQDRRAHPSRSQRIPERARVAQRFPELPEITQFLPFSLRRKKLTLVLAEITLRRFRFGLLCIRLRGREGPRGLLFIFVCKRTDCLARC